MQAKKYIVIWLIGIGVVLNGNNNSYNIIVRDYGIGINDETINKAFQKFFKGDKSRRTEGSGLGLSIVKQIRPFIY